MSLAIQDYNNTGVLIGHAQNCNGICCNAEIPYYKTASFLKTASVFGNQAADDYYRMSSGDSWWQIYGDEMMIVEDRLAKEYAASKPEREAAANVAIAAFECKAKAERVAVRNGAACNRRGAVQIQKRPEPCKFLYNCQGTPARPTTLHVTTECWSHEYKDPKTGAIVAKHVCDRLHPGEQGWLAAWQNNRLEGANRFNNLREKRRF